MRFIYDSAIKFMSLSYRTGIREEGVCPVASEVTSIRVSLPVTV